MSTSPSFPSGERMTLQDKLDTFKAAFEADQLPFTLTEQEHALMRKAIQTQIASGIAERALKIGDAAPGFTLPDSENRPCSSTALLAKGPLVVSFYRGIWCPYCTIDLQALQAALPAITQHGAQLVAISPQSAVHNRQAARDHDLTFPLLSDAGNRLAAQFGLRYACRTR
ncbi:peroxiredoxin-like family protein [uncultured Serratia sp.]|uniref:peroxiredoxin-like family protein n=1 Tax=uncultured Serratia sp. TaxID=239175 RepID=UPI002585594D|nr:peroxiredoxin-like family protein [uncultured Serratia sp.]